MFLSPRFTTMAQSAMEHNAITPAFRVFGIAQSTRDRTIQNHPPFPNEVINFQKPFIKSCLIYSRIHNNIKETIIINIFSFSKYSSNLLPTNAQQILLIPFEMEYSQIESIYLKIYLPCFIV